MSTEIIPSTPRLLEELSGKNICFAGNSWEGSGGQGEFLRSMVFVLDHLTGGTVYCRSNTARIARSIPLHSSSLPWGPLHRVLSGPVLRRRSDWLTLVSDLQFDRSLALKIGKADLFDGVMG